MARRVWVSCKNCGNRYPKNEGSGWNREFCCDGCQDTWEDNHPGYSKNAKKRRIRLRWLKILFPIVSLVVLVFVPGNIALIGLIVCSLIYALIWVL